MPRLALLFLLLLGLTPVPAAAELTVRPFFIEASLTPRESVTETIKIDSSYAARIATVFPTVNEITVGTEGEIKEFASPVMTDRTNTVTSWIKITRGQQKIQPGASVEIPLTITAHPQAKPGEYHAFIGLIEARNRTVAEEILAKGDAKGIILKVTIEDQRVDTMRVGSLSVERFVTNPDTQQLSVTVENPGEVTSAPQGELIFYDSRGFEVGAAAVNADGVAIEPGETETFTVPIPIEDKVGRFKANLNMQYGNSQVANLYDTTSFFMIPSWYLVLLFAGVTILLTVLVLLIRRATGTVAKNEHGDEVALYVREGHDENPQDHDIDLKSK